MRRPASHPAARQGDGRLVLDQRPDVRARAGARTTTAGASSAMRAGAMPTCCRISARPSTSSAARTNFMAQDGPLSVSDLGDLPICDAFIEAAEQCGYPRNPDFNGARRKASATTSSPRATGGAARPPSAISSPRASAANLTVHLERARDARAVRGQARGRHRISPGRHEDARARGGEIILAGGAFNSPQLMQLSGVGPAALLRQHGIDGDRRHAGRRRRPAGPLSTRG